jgi:Fe-S oxidoreductase
MGMHPSKRLEWTKDLNVKTAPTTQKADILYFVCCLTAYDARNQNIAKSMTSIFDKLGISYANLGTDEWCCGDHQLRLGEKGLFESLAEHNVASLGKFEASRIVTLSPHCYNTFKNDKPYSDAKLNVQHFTQFLAEKLDSGELKLPRTVQKRVAYHDPCFLGKRNKIFDPPRHILQSVKGLELVEMRRNRESSFCCGGGAGRTWTEEADPDKRPSVDRVKEALDLGVEVIATACPFCVTTLEDAIKVLDVENKIVVRDISELLKETI